MKRRSFLKGLLGIAATAVAGIKAQVGQSLHIVPRHDFYLTDSDAWFLTGLDQDGHQAKETVYLVDGLGQSKGRFATISEARSKAEPASGTILVLPTTNEDTKWTTSIERSKDIVSSARLR